MRLWLEKHAEDGARAFTQRDGGSPAICWNPRSVRSRASSSDLCHEFEGGVSKSDAAAHGWASQPGETGSAWQIVPTMATIIAINSVAAATFGMGSLLTLFEQVSAPRDPATVNCFTRPKEKSAGRYNPPISQGNF